MDVITVHVKGNPYPLRFRNQAQSEYTHARLAVLNGHGFILKSDELGEFIFSPGSVSHVSSYMGVR